jgi:hypothetical protein
MRSLEWFFATRALLPTPWYSGWGVPLTVVASQYDDVDICVSLRTYGDHGECEGMSRPRLIGTKVKVNPFSVGPFLNYAGPGMGGAGEGRKVVGSLATVEVRVGHSDKSRLLNAME